MEIDFSDAAVTFVNAIDEQALSPYARRGSVEFVDQVIDGIREVLPRLSPDSLQIRALKVTLTELQAHPLDSSPHDFRVAAMEAMTKAIQSVGLSPGPQ